MPGGDGTGPQGQGPMAGGGIEVEAKAVALLKDPVVSADARTVGIKKHIN